jgi:hypothetical protein
LQPSDDLAPLDLERFMKFIVHESPVRRSDSNYIARVDLAPFDLEGEMEQLWLRRLDGEHFSLCCIPFRAYGLALDDVVDISADGTTVIRLVRTSGRRVLRVLFMPGVGLPAVLEQIKSEVSRLGLMSEWSGDRHIAIDVPLGVDIASILEIAEREEAGSRAYWEWADATPFVTAQL